MNIEPTFRTTDPGVDWSRLTLLSVALGRLPATADEYGCPACLRKSCPGCSEWLFAETCDERGLPY